MHHARTLLSSDLREAFAAYWAAFVKALNPDKTRPDIRHPSAVSYEDQLNTANFLTACLNLLTHPLLIRQMRQFQLTFGVILSGSKQLCSKRRWRRAAAAMNVDFG